MENIEVEIRAFLSLEEYTQLQAFFNAEAVSSREDNQLTYYFTGPDDLRIQKNDYYAKIWMKKWLIHDEAREEIEIKCDRNDFSTLEHLFLALWYDVEIVRQRKRLHYTRWDIDVSLDDTTGYGYILELEILCEKDKQEANIAYLKTKFAELGIVITPKEVFQEKYDWYKENWRQIIQL